MSEIRPTPIVFTVLLETAFIAVQLSAAERSWNVHCCDQLTHPHNGRRLRGDGHRHSAFEAQGRIQAVTAAVEKNAQHKGDLS